MCALVSIRFGNISGLWFEFGLEKIGFEGVKKAGTKNKAARILESSKIRYVRVCFFG